MKAMLRVLSASSLALFALGSLTPAYAARLEQKAPQDSVFIPFVNRYLHFPIEWTATVDKDKAVFERWVTEFQDNAAASSAPAAAPAAPAGETASQKRRRVRQDRRVRVRFPDRASSGAAGAATPTPSMELQKVRRKIGSFTIVPIDSRDCDVKTIQKTLEQENPGKLTIEDKAVTYVRVPGDQGSALRFLRPLDGGGKEIVLCLMPPNRVNVSRISIPESETDTFEFVRTGVLPTLVKEVKKARSSY